ncbi:hypothetical protein [Corallococcus sicarius]|uniref:Extensin-like C-terminal domain-containing protein n=1 Tax=Corallococcus sicarius TaxID=2316726 RepID=A0A3A8MUE7_9BACT|nr:hypothetical protein [Corallococcus sicarius]RKH33341.1 hypothetical protein D7X12_36150 [Corallococcus sicarius]
MSTYTENEGTSPEPGPKETRGVPAPIQGKELSKPALEFPPSFEITEQAIASAGTSEARETGGVSLEAIASVPQPEGVTPAGMKGQRISASEIWGQPTFYEGAFENQHSTGGGRSFTYDSQFYVQCERWLKFWFDNNPWRSPVWVVSFGVQVDKPGWHGTGQAFDLTRMYSTRPDTGGFSQLFYADWRDWHTSPAAAWYAKLYWGTVASLTYYFDVVLTYSYDDSLSDSHQNHVHFDVSENASSGGSWLLGRWHSSRSQITNMQYILALCWGINSVKGTHVYDNATKAGAAAVMKRIGRPGRLPSDSQNDWLTFHHASWQHASGGHVYA